MTTLDNDLYVKKSLKYVCEKCDYMTCKKSSFQNHINSKKHNSVTNSTPDNAFYAKLCSKKIKKYTCEFCSKEYGDRAGLWRHKKKCSNDEKLNNNYKQSDFVSSKTDNEVIMLLIKENSELKNMMMEVIKNGTHNTTNSNNKTFNLNLFLNETCKDAINITDFVSSIRVNLEDLETTGRLGNGQRKPKKNQY